MKVTKYRVNGKGSYPTLEEAAAAANRIFQRYGVIVEVTTYQGRMDRTEWLLQPIEAHYQRKGFRAQGMSGNAYGKGEERKPSTPGRLPRRRTVDLREMWTHVPGD